MSKKVPLPDWCKEAKKAMIDHDDMSVNELAASIGNSRAYVSSVLNGALDSPEIKRKIQLFLGLQVDETRAAS